MLYHLFDLSYTGLPNKDETLKNIYLFRNKTLNKTLKIWFLSLSLKNIVFIGLQARN